MTDNTEDYCQFWRDYYAADLTPFKDRVDAFANQLGYKNAVAVPKADRETFIRMYHNDVFGLRA